MPVSLCNVIPGMVNIDTAGGGEGVGRGVGGGGVGESGVDSPVEDSDDDLMPGSLCNVIPGMVNIDTARKQKTRLRLVYFVLCSTAKKWSWDLDLKSHTKEEAGTRPTQDRWLNYYICHQVFYIRLISHSIFLFF